MSSARQELAGTPPIPHAGTLASQLGIPRAAAARNAASFRGGSDADTLSSRWSEGEQQQEQLLPALLAHAVFLYRGRDAAGMHAQCAVASTQAYPALVSYS